MFVFLTTALAADLFSELHRFEPDDRRLDLDLARGTLTVSTDRFADVISVRVSPREPCTVTRGQQGAATLSVKDCAADVVVIAPPGVNLRLEVGSGDVTLDTASRLWLSVGTGDVAGRAQGPVRVAVGTGNVRLEGLTERPVVAVATGQTELRYATGG